LQLTLPFAPGLFTLEWTHPAKLIPSIQIVTTTEFASTGDPPSVK